MLPQLKIGMKLFLYHTLSDAELIVHVSTGDDHAFAEIYKRYAEPIYRHIRKRISCRDDARDVLHDIFTSLWQRRESLPEARQLSAFLFAAAKYRVINYLSKHQFREGALVEFQRHFPLDSMGADHLVRERELSSLIETAVSSLPDKMQVIFRMSRQEHLSHKEIAENLNLSETTVKKQVANALKILKIKLVG